MKDFAVSLMLDSGAFSAWKRNDPIDIKQYMAFIKTNKHLLNSYVCLDVIPGNSGMMIRTAPEVEKSAKKSYDNLQIMRGQGLEPIPVFHQGENFRWLDRLLADGIQYIGISPYLRASKQEQIKWLDEVYTALTDTSGVPYVKTHGFGITWHTPIFRYPWFSIDSTSWSIGAGYGNIYVPPFIHGAHDYRREPIQIAVSGINRVSRGNKSRSFEDLGDTAYNSVKHFIEHEVGTTIAEVRNTTVARTRAYLTYYLKLQEFLYSLPPVRFTHQHRGLLDITHSSGLKPQKFRMKIIYSLGIRASMQNSLLNELKVRDRLLSYYELKQTKNTRLDAYVKTGLRNKRRPFKAPKQNWELRRYVSFREMQLIKRLEGYRDANEAE